MRGIIPAAILLVLLFVAAQSRSANAYETYCFDDPVFLIGGRILDVQVQQPVETVLTARSTTLTVIIPSNVSGTILIDDVSAFPMETTIVQSGDPWQGGPIPVLIVVFVDASLDYPIRLVATQLLSDAGGSLLRSARAEGSSNVQLELPVFLTEFGVTTPTPTPTPTPTMTPSPTPLPTVIPTLPPTVTPTATPTGTTTPAPTATATPSATPPPATSTPTPPAGPPIDIRPQSTSTPTPTTSTGARLPQPGVLPVDLGR